MRARLIFLLAVLLLGITVFVLGLVLSSARLFVYASILTFLPLTLFLLMARHGAADRALGGVRITVDPVEVRRGESLRCTIRVSPPQPMALRVHAGVIARRSHTNVHELTVPAGGPGRAEGETEYQTLILIPADAPPTSDESEVAWGVFVHIEENGVRIWEDARSIEVLE